MAAVSLAVVTNDIYTRQDPISDSSGNIACRTSDGVETGGCRIQHCEDASMNLKPLRAWSAPMRIWNWSSSRAAATISLRLQPELVDVAIYVIACGRDKIPRKADRGSCGRTCW